MDYIIIVENIGILNFIINNKRNNNKYLNNKLII